MYILLFSSSRVRWSLLGKKGRTVFVNHRSRRRSLFQIPRRDKFHVFPHCWGLRPASKTNTVSMCPCCAEKAGGGIYCSRHMGNRKAGGLQRLERRNKDWPMLLLSSALTVEPVGCAETSIPAYMYSFLCEPLIVRFALRDVA